MILALAFALQLISLPSTLGFVLVDEDVVSINEGIIRDESGSAANQALSALRIVADSLELVRSMATCIAGNIQVANFSCPQVLIDDGSLGCVHHAGAQRRSVWTLQRYHNAFIRCFGHGRPRLAARWNALSHEA